MGDDQVTKWVIFDHFGRSVRRPLCIPIATATATCWPVANCQKRTTEYRVKLRPSFVELEPRVITGCLQSWEKAVPSPIPSIFFLVGTSRHAWEPYIAAFEAQLHTDGWTKGADYQIEYQP